MRSEDLHLGASLFARWPSYLRRPCTFLQVAHLQGTMIIDFKKVSQALHNSFSVSFTKACYNTLDWAISIFLLVGQQLERIDPVFTQTLRRRLRFLKPLPDWH